MSLLKLLTKKARRTLFTTPSHNQQSLFIQGFEGFYALDYSEIEGFDNLHNPKGAILMAQGKASDIYNTQKTFFLTNGSTSGILAIMKTILSPNDKVLVARNCHKSVYNALVLTQSSVEWLMPTKNEEWGIYGEIDPKTLEDILNLNQYKAFVLTSPTYDGVNSDIGKIAQICRERGVYFVVDEAHGALYNFSDKFPKTAIEQGADFSVNSLHKNAGTPNPCALLHMSKDCQGIEWRQLQNSLNLFTTTSPSYPLLAAIEACIDFLHSQGGRKAINKLISEIEEFQKPLKKLGWEFLNADITKILIKKGAICPKTLSEKLFLEYHIEDELVNANSVLFLTGIGTTRQKLDKLKNALKKIDISEQCTSQEAFQPYPFVKLQPYQAFNRDYDYISKEDAVLKVSAETVIPYPPCTGILFPGEVIQEWHLPYLNDDVKVLKK